MPSVSCSSPVTANPKRIHRTSVSNNFPIHYRINIYPVKNKLFSCWCYPQPFTIVISRHLKF